MFMPAGRPRKPEGETTKKSMYSFPPHILKIIEEKAASKEISKSQYLVELVEKDNQDNPLVEDYRENEFCNLRTRLMAKAQAYSKCMKLAIDNDGKYTSKTRMEFKRIRSDPDVGDILKSINDRDFAHIKQDCFDYYNEKLSKTIRTSKQVQIFQSVLCSTIIGYVVKGIGNGKNTDESKKRLQEIEKDIEKLENWHKYVMKDDNVHAMFLIRLEEGHYDMSKIPPEIKARLSDKISSIKSQKSDD